MAQFYYFSTCAWVLAFRGEGAMVHSWILKDRRRERPATTEYPDLVFSHGTEGAETYGVSYFPCNYAIAILVHTCALRICYKEASQELCLLRAPAITRMSGRSCYFCRRSCAALSSCDELRCSDQLPIPSLVLRPSLHDLLSTTPSASAKGTETIHHPHNRKGRSRLK